MDLLMKKTILVSSIMLTLVATNVEAALVLNVTGYPDPDFGTPEQTFTGYSTESANFTMLYIDGSSVGGTNDVNMVWDGNAYDASSDYTGPGSTANVTAFSTTPFFGHNWAAHDIQMFVPGNYSFDVTLGGGNPEVGSLNVTVPAGFMGLHMLFEWGGNLNIDMFVVLAPNSVFGSGIGRSVSGVTASGAKNCDAGVITNCLWDGAGLGPDGKPAGDKVWMMASVDGDGDGIMGIPMAAGGPFAGFSANFNADLPAVVPIPAAVWLFGSGLLGLAGVARRKPSI